MTCRYQEEIDKLAGYRDEVDKLMTEEKEILTTFREKTKNKYVSGGFTFMTNQVANIIKINELALNLTKNIIETKSRSFNEDMKESANKTGNNELPDSVHKVIEDTFKQSNGSSIANFLPDEINSNIVLIVNEEFSPLYFAEVNDKYEIVKQIDDSDVKTITEDCMDKEALVVQYKGEVFDIFQISESWEQNE